MSINQKASLEQKKEGQGSYASEAGTCSNGFAFEQQN